MWNGTAETLKQKPANRNTRPKVEPDAALPGRLRDAGEAHRAGEAVDQRGAVEQHAGRERAEHEILQARFGRAHAVAVDRRHHVEREAHQLEAEIERDQVGRRDQHQHAGGREQDQDRELELLLLLGRADSRAPARSSTGRADQRRGSSERGRNRRPRSCRRRSRACLPAAHRRSAPASDEQRERAAS